MDVYLRIGLRNHSMMSLKRVSFLFLEEIYEDKINRTVMNTAALYRYTKTKYFQIVPTISGFRLDRTKGRF